jgi:hypothetical protein
MNEPGVAAEAEFFGPDANGSLMRPARPDEAGALAQILIDVVTWGRLRDLGLAFNTLMHRSFITSKYGICLVVECDGEIRAYGAGVSDMGRFHRGMVLRHGLQMGLLLLPKMFRLMNLKTALRAFTYFPQASKDDPKSELVCMNVRSEFQSEGYGRRLFKGLMHELKKKGVETVKLGHVDPGKEVANSYWLGMGARLLRTERFYKNKQVNVYIYDIP